MSITEFIVSRFTRLKVRTRMFLVTVIFCCSLYAFFSLTIYINKHQSRNYWQDGKRVGKDLNSDELAVLNIAQNEMTVNFRKTLSEEELKLLDKLCDRATRSVSRHGVVNYKSSYRKKEESIIVRKMFIHRRDYRKKLPRAERKILTSAIAKLSLEEKLKLSGNGFIVL